MPVIFLLTSSFVESAANPAGDARGGLFFLFRAPLCVLFAPRFSSGREISQLSDEIRGPFDGQVLVGEEGFLFFPVPGICPQNLIHKVAEKCEATGSIG